MTVRVAGLAIPTDPRAVVRRVRSELLTLSRGLRIWLGLLAALMLLGAVGAARSLFPGDKALGTTPSFEWGLLIIGYVFFAITTSGLCLASSLGTVFGIERFKPLEKRHAILALLCLVTAFGIIALDLHYPVRMVLGAVFSPSLSSPMWWMGAVYGVYLCFLLVEVWSMFTGHPRIHRVACICSSAAAVVAPTTLGAVFAVVAVRPFWHGLFTPMLMLATAFLSGTALLGIAFGLVHRFRLAGAERAGQLAIPALRFLLLIGLGIVSVLIARQLLAGALNAEPGLGEVTSALVAGPLAMEYWGLRIIAGLAIPVVLLLVPATRTPSGLLAASVMILAGAFVDRHTFVVAGQIVPTTAVSGVVTTGFVPYTPSPVEVIILLGAAAFVAFVYTLAERYLDLRESDFHVALSLGWLRHLWPSRTASVHADEDLALVATEPAQEGTT